MASLPTGTVTFLFTDIEGSTSLIQHFGDQRYAEVLAEHQRLLRDAFATENGHEVDTQGDAFLVAFPRARDALAAAVVAQRSLMNHQWPDGMPLRVRMGLHTGEAVTRTGGYVGLDVHRVARICSAAHGGQILVSDVTQGLVTRDLPDGVSLRDLGEHRLRDLARPHHLFQVLAPNLQADFPQLRSLDVHRHNLPIQLTSFIGREKEIAEVKRLLGAARLATLTGSGGAGKTRLALQVAADVVESNPNGVWLAEFAPIADPVLVPKTVATALGVPEQPGRDMAETLVDALRQKTLLLLLDNCEHLLAACRSLAAALLSKCPQVRILATSREGLGVPGEILWRVPSLSVPEDIRHLPPPDRLILYDAVRLFVDRAVTTAPGFTVTAENASAIAQICQQLDGIPLAIELAAVRVKVLTVEQIAARLNDRFRLLTGGSQVLLPHHQTLRATLDWSYDLLSEREQILLRRLSVFAGGFTLEAAEQICGGEGVDDSDFLDLLTRLVDKSLVVFDEREGQARYRLLESVRQYGLGRLQEAGGADDVRRRHRDWYLALAEQAQSELFGPRSGLWLERLETEHDNMRAALERSKGEAHGAEAGLRLAGALWWFWIRHGDWSEGRQWLVGALARSAEAPPAALPRALAGASQLAWRQGDYEMAETLAAKGLTLCRQLGDKEDRENKKNAVLLIYQLGVAAIRGKDSERATALFGECLALSNELGHKWFGGHALAALGLVAQWYSGNRERATALFAESLASYREVGDIWGITYALRNLGFAALYQSDYGRAAASIVESLALCRAMRDRWLSEECLEGLARIASAKGQCEHAARLFGTTEALRETLGWHPALPDHAYHDRCVASARAGLDETAFAAAWAEGRAMTLEQAIEYALTPEQAGK